ncbi:MAG: hypothetical protein WBD09_01490, partial [Halobacteriota archaeon]
YAFSVLELNLRIFFIMIGSISSRWLYDFLTVLFKKWGVFQNSLESIWNDIPHIYQLAQRISPNDNDFNYLHPAQLIKHILGLKRKYGKNGFRLLYLWYDTLGEEGLRHKEEIERFTEISKDDGVKFQSISYQELILRLRKDCLDEHSEYINYLSNRYF